MTLIRCYSTRLAVNHLSFRPSCTHLLPRRGYAKPSEKLPTRYKVDPVDTPLSVQNEFIGHVLTAFRNLGKLFAWIGYGTFVFGTVTLIAFEGGHLWVEQKMRLNRDEDAERWGWEPEGWTGGEAGGTSPALGIYGRHAVRAAWLALQPIPLTPWGKPGQDTEILYPTTKDLQDARRYLEVAMARIRDLKGKLPLNRVGLDLLERHAAVLELMGTRATLVHARENYVSLLESRADEPLVQARYSVKLGNISERLGDGDGALHWWSRAIELTQGEGAMSKIILPGHEAQTATLSPPQYDRGVLGSALRKWSSTNADGDTASPASEVPLKVHLPSRPPISPAAQRTLVAALISISAHYSKRQQLSEAIQVQEYAIPLIEEMVPQRNTSSDSLTSHTSGQTLHYMYLMQRKSVLSVHHGEVTYSMGKQSAPTESLTDLLTAASSSELVAQVLTGASAALPDTRSELSPQVGTHKLSKVAYPPASKTVLASPYLNSSSLRIAAQGILRDARITAMEAWELSGMLFESIKDNDAKVAECYHRALGWMGGGPAQEGEDDARSGGRERQILLEKYFKARERVLKKHQSRGQGEAKRDG